MTANAQHLNLIVKRLRSMEAAGKTNSKHYKKLAEQVKNLTGRKYVSGSLKSTPKQLGHGMNKVQYGTWRVKDTVRRGAGAGARHGKRAASAFKRKGAQVLNTPNGIYATAAGIAVGSVGTGAAIAHMRTKRAKFAARTGGKRGYHRRQGIKSSIAGMGLGYGAYGLARAATGNLRHAQGLQGLRMTKEAAKAAKKGKIGLAVAGAGTVASLGFTGSAYYHSFKENSSPVAMQRKRKKTIAAKKRQRASAVARKKPSSPYYYRKQGGKRVRVKNNRKRKR